MRIFEVTKAEFKAWFGQSKLVNADGSPMVFYHGTRAEFDTFTPSRSGEFGPGIYLSTDDGSASFFGGQNRTASGPVKIMSVYVRMEKPFEVTKHDWFDLTMVEEPDEDGELEPIGPGEASRRLQAQGYDGIIGIGINGTDRQYVVFSPNQVKSVSNNGGFGKHSNNIFD